MSSVGLDAKGRMSIPTKYRDQLMAECDGRLVLSLDRSPNLLMFPEPAWDVLQQELTSIGASDKAVRLRRLYLGSAEHVKMDSAGRILVSPELRKRIGLETGAGATKACVVGQGGKFEIWREDTWSQYLDDVMVDAKDLDLGSDDADAQIASRLTML